MNHGEVDYMNLWIDDIPPALFFHFHGFYFYPYHLKFKVPWELSSYTTSNIPKSVLGPIMSHIMEQKQRFRQESACYYSRPFQYVWPFEFTFIYELSEVVSDSN